MKEKHHQCSCGKPKCNFNIPAECDCKSKFDIREDVTALINGIPEQGTLFFKGRVCPDCNNKNSIFTLKFRDSDQSDGDQSFTLKPLAINPPLCGTSGDNFFQQSCGVGIFDPVDGDKQAVTFEVLLIETLGTGDDFFGILILGLCGSSFLISIESAVPDEDIKVKECDETDECEEHDEETDE